MSVSLPPIISDGMVIQRDAPIRLWGVSDEAVAVSFLDQRAAAEPYADGFWEIALKPLPYGGPYALSINDQIITDVYVGDVFLCSGQSNMEMTLASACHMYPEELRASNPFIRQFTVPLRTAFERPERELAGGGWIGASPETLPFFSSAAYFFAKRLYEKYRMPIGIIVAAVGGSPIEAWMSRDALKDFPEKLARADRFVDASLVENTRSRQQDVSAEFVRSIDRGDPGLSERWFDPDYDDGAWETRSLMTPWEGTGSVWFRKTVAVPSGLAGKPATLFLGSVIDIDYTYANGKMLGGTTNRYPLREYKIPSLPDGRLTIAMRVISINGGRFIRGKQYILSTREGSLFLDGDWRFHTGGSGTPPVPQAEGAEPSPGEKPLHYEPTGLYNGMIAPLARSAVKGMIWYQGESDTHSPERYAEQFAALAQGWRADWGCDFPIAFVELPHWEEGENWDALRAQQRRCLNVPHTAMAAAFDLGEHNDLHPQGKQVIGDRLARCMMRIAYGERLRVSPFEIVIYKGE
ncbi:MAG: sialate O-acetylesterase [Oscillospiraceae bacterium]|jgi:sialate O-acetylesterase|nr:sialate O-acetylesterase [Oscillospiraceae bacterium]